MHPYRTASPDDGDPPSPPPPEEWVLGWALLVLGAVRVAVACAMHERFETEVTIAAILCVLGAAYLVRLARMRAGSRRRST
jgi:MYXO-CTERM domain-containing protein